jgi:hypothetical protein
MERTALSLVQSVGASENFGAEFFWLSPARQQMTMISVRREEIIIGAQAGNRRHAGAFLADVKMIMPTENAFVVERDKAFFEVTYDKHSAA